MDLTPLLHQVRDDVSQGQVLLKGVRLVLCLGSRAQVALLMATPARILGAATTATEGLALVRQHQPTLLLVSDRLELGCGVDLVVQVKRSHPEVRTLLVLTQEHQLALIQAALRAGCDGIVPESRLLHGSTLQALRTVLGGGMYLDRSLVRALQTGQETGGRHEGLSNRERQVLERVVQGLSNPEIAGDLMVSVDTVKTHVRNVLLKLRVRGRIQAVVTGLQLGLVDWPQPGGTR
ncbi:MULTISPECIES: response regulator transcription factor [unclassified Cyanobium]|uniref:LuxR C-terminal-related transcriptional regulator n=1 Tax=unclassified Cyanobium TaxID=2627006 RepID=UPI0020CE07DA|nr:MULTISPECIES: response regulator transcription factor [unclassified Cyanobium]MCP9833448.1 response regulator transcription factor [Cyanobium sp. La Preciosa 7G6]MCP9936213.1 response regulator transcription factor [Cyanobium sp. Aljojuca 7A6]